MNIVTIIVFAILIEAIIQLVKPLWGVKLIGKLSITEAVSMALGVLIAVLGKLNVADVLNVMQPVVLNIMYVFTGMAMGRGASFIHDLWLKISASIGDTYQ